FSLDFVDDILSIFAEGAAQDIRAAGRQTSERFTNLQDVLFINDQAERALETRLERGMRTMDRAEPLITAGKLHFFAFVRRAGTDDGNDRDEGIDILDVAHFAERNHGRAFDMVD